MNVHCTPEIYLAVQREHIIAETPELEEMIRSRMRYSAGHPEKIETSRKIVNMIGLHKVCPRRGCGRAGSCQTRYVSCIWENLGFMQQHVFPLLDKMLADYPAGDED